MVVEITVSKVSVSKIRSKLYGIVLNLTATENAVTLINKNFIQLYRTGDAPATVVNRFYYDMQTCISDYIEEQDIYNAAALDNAITNLEGNLIWQ